MFCIVVVPHTSTVDALLTCVHATLFSSSFVMRLVHDPLAFTVFLLTASLYFTQFLSYT